MAMGTLVNRRHLSVVLTALMLVSFPAAVVAGTPDDLDRRAVVTISGAAQEQAVGYALAGAGDVNGDGSPDLLVRPSIYRSKGPVAYVIFGGSSDPVDIGALGDQGFAITMSESAEAGDIRSNDVTGLAAAGDMNADGFDDVVIGVPWTDHNERVNSGSAYLVYGKTDSGTVDLSTLGTSGVTIDGADAKDEAGVAVASADVDGDGTNDILVGAPFAGDALPNPGKAYVVFGGSLTSVIDLALPFDGFAIEGARGRQVFGAAIAAAGDMNDDGLEEIVVGAPADSYRVRSGAYIVVGKATHDEVDIAADDWDGWEIRPRRRSSVGHAVAGGSDFNGDGNPDVLIGDPDALGSKDWDSGAAYVIFGLPETSVVRVDELGGSGLRIERAGRLAKTGHSVAFVPDVNGDGRAEAAVGSPSSSDFGEYETGRVDVVPGTNAAGSIDVRTSDDVVTYVGSGSENAGISVAVAGDFAATGETLLAVGAPEASFGDSYYQGMVYLVPAVAPANDLPPRATLYSYSARQRGQPGNHCWDGVCVDRIPAFPAPEKGSIKNDALIRFGISERPADTALTFYREVDEFGRPAGAGRPIDHRVHRIDRRSNSGYEVRFNLPRRTGHAYLALQARWPGDDKGDAGWFFHLRLNRHTYTDIPGPPKAHLFTGATRQRGLTLTYGWSQSYVDGFTSHLIADAFRYGFPSAKPAAHGAAAAIRVHNRYRPDHFVIRLYRRVERDGDEVWSSEYPMGPRRIMDFTWRTVRSEGRIVAHDAFFRLPGRGKHAYLEVRGRWRHHGTAPWQFHLRFQ